MNIDLTLQQDEVSPLLHLTEQDIIYTIATILKHIDFQYDIEIGIACVNQDESQNLNNQYRHKNKPTNVLSFPSEIHADIVNNLPLYPLGDLVICIPVVIAEAQQQNKLPMQHFTHLVVHGVLHLLGYDHELSEQDALEMETLEINILEKLSIPNPYE